MIRIACVGDNVVDINYIDGMIHPGGNCVNVAVYSSQMGHEAAYIGVLADDGYARIVKDSLTANGVDWSESVVLHGETGRCTCRLVDGDRILGDENDGGLVKSDPLSITPDLISYLAKFDMIHTSCYSYLDDQMARLQETGIPILYDFSTAWDRELVEKIAPYADYLLFSARDELSEEENYQMMKVSVEQYGCGMAVMTRGIRGAWVYDGRRVFEKQPYHVEGGAVDTTGCGDSWISGFITTYVEAMNRIHGMEDTADHAFVTEKNMEDAHGKCVELGMCMGNLKARHTCRIKGAYGCGVAIEQFEKEKIG